MKIQKMISKSRIVLIVLVLLAFSFSGAHAAAPQITSLSATTLTRSGRLRIFGSAFGLDGQVLINGLNAPIADWTDTLIVAYVPEGATVGTDSVQVVTAGGSSNIVNLDVTTRQQVGRVRWRFQHDGMYTIVRPAVAPDGTIYLVDVSSRLYALDPSGGLKWIVRGAGNKGVTVGADGTIYTGSESAIKAFNPDGTEKWTFVQNPAAFILLGPNVGPNGNIYSVASSGIGVFALSPAGQLLWTNPEAYDRLIVDYQEVVFGPNGANQQLVFMANNHLRSLLLNGTPVFTLAGNGNQPAVGPDGTIYTTYTFLSAYTPGGSLKWTFTGILQNTATPPDVGPDGVVYFVQNLSTLYAINPDGTQRWGSVVSDILDAPIVDPLNAQAIMGGQPNYGISGFFKSVSTASGAELWRVTLADENGGQQEPDSRGRFSADGQTVYITSQILGGNPGDVYGYLYALDSSTGGGQPVLRSTAINLSARLRNGTVTASGRVTVKDGNAVAVPGAVVSITWTLPGGSTISQSAITNPNGIASFRTSGSQGTYTLTVTNIAKSGYVFDPAGSILTKSITK